MRTSLASQARIALAVIAALDSLAGPPAYARAGSVSADVGVLLYRTGGGHLVVAHCSARAAPDGDVPTGTRVACAVNARETTFQAPGPAVAMVVSEAVPLGSTIVVCRAASANFVSPSGTRHTAVAPRTCYDVTPL